MSTTIPLFPLGSVLYPGLVLPLHIFEDRYRQLVADLLAGPGPRQCGVIAIRHGRETGIDGVSALYDMGCMAELRQVEPYDDGRFDLITVGMQRFKLRGLGDADPYYTGDGEVVPAEAGGAGLPVKQHLLEEPDGLRRLRAERTLLARETQMLRSLTATPAPDL